MPLRKLALGAVFLGAIAFSFSAVAQQNAFADDAQAPSLAFRRLDIAKVGFKPVNSHLAKQGYAQEVTVEIGYKGTKPTFWGKETGKWLVDVALVYPHGKTYRRLRLRNGTTVPAGAMPSFNSLTQKYIATFVLASDDLASKTGKVALTGDFVLNHFLTGVRFETVSDAKFQKGKRMALASAPLWVAVPKIGSKK